MSVYRPFIKKAPCKNRTLIQVRIKALFCQIAFVEWVEYRQSQEPQWGHLHAQTGVGFLPEQEQDKGEECQTQVTHRYTERHFVSGLRMCFRTLFAVFDVRQQNHRPHKEEANT